jgi:hypothetical protein
MPRELTDATQEVQMNSVYDEKVLREAIRSFMDAGRIATSPEMRLVCHGLASLAFSINELQKRLHFVEERVGGSPMRDIWIKSAAEKRDLRRGIFEEHFRRANWG